MNKLAHGLIAAYFGLACWFLWGMLTLTIGMTQRLLANEQIPAFSRFCFGVRPVLVILPVLALAYCVYAWFRREQKQGAWIGYFAGTTMVLILLMLPTVIAAWLPWLSVLGKIGAPATTAG